MCQHCNDSGIIMKGIMVVPCIYCQLVEEKKQEPIQLPTQEQKPKHNNGAIMYCAKKECDGNCQDCLLLI